MKRKRIINAVWKYIHCKSFSNEGNLRWTDSISYHSRLAPQEDEFLYGVPERQSTDKQLILPFGHLLRETYTIQSNPLLVEAGSHSYGKVRDCSIPLMERFRQMPCLVLQASRTLGLPSEDGLPYLALRTVRNHPTVLLDKSLLIHMGHEVLEEILKGEMIAANELTLFEIVQKWSQCHE